MKKILILAAILSAALISCNRSEIVDDSISAAEPQDEGTSLVVRAVIGDVNNTKPQYRPTGKAFSGPRAMP